jgi:hypothetical protein
MIDPIDCPISETMACRQLWQAVILNGLKDALGLPCREQWEAHAWIMGAREDFRFVCESGGYNPMKVREEYVKLSKKGKVITGRRI